MLVNLLRQFRFLMIKTLTVIILILSLIRLLYFRKKILIRLIILEFMVLNLFITLIIIFVEFNQPLSISFYLLILGACETRLRLSLLIIITRFKGNDMLRLISKTKF